MAQQPAQTLTRQQLRALQWRANTIQAVLRQNHTLREQLASALADLATARDERDAAHERAQKSANEAAAAKAQKSKRQTKAAEA